MKCKWCGNIEPDSRWNKRFGKHELCEDCLRYQEYFKSKYISYVLKQAGIKNNYGYLTVKARPRDNKETVTIIEERPFDRMDFGILINELEYALKDDVLPFDPFGSLKIRFTLSKAKYNVKNIYLSNSEINNTIEAFYNNDSIVCIEYSDYPEEIRLKLEYAVTPTKLKG